MTSQGHAYARFQRALKSGNAHLAARGCGRTSSGESCGCALAAAASPRAKPVLYDKTAVRWFAKYAADDRYLVLRDARELIDLLDGVGRYDQVAVLRLERWLRARGYDDEADRVA
jgi:hypothetical protein